MTLNYAIIKKVKDWPPYSAIGTANKAHALKILDILKNENPTARYWIIDITETEVLERKP